MPTPGNVEPAFSLGIEEEYLLVDLATRDLVSDPLNAAQFLLSRPQDALGRTKNLQEPSYPDGADFRQHVQGDKGLGFRHKAGHTSNRGRMQ